MSNFTQPICDLCWQERNPEQRPFRLKKLAVENCAFCGHRTVSGIYTRVDPTTVPFPQRSNYD